ncbi:hypothetical protein SLEP1_g9289 [Rubroshorea leprosula]|uniref:Uncharacterized protein n=1 Tax=Rubroshorea leprosula TaxID=152421 RepID=A0AAV5IEB5_9ROSI|nr:hypothetical protein SLEP1_g9289 [Rubroshorea leprosula]
MTSFWLNRRLYGADSASGSAILRLRNKRKRKSAMKNLKGGFRRLKAEMQEISKEQQSIKEGQKQVREKLEAIEAECAQLRKDTDLMIRQRTKAGYLYNGQIRNNCQ